MDIILFWSVFNTPAFCRLQSSVGEDGLSSLKSDCTFSHMIGLSTCYDLEFATSRERSMLISESSIPKMVLTSQPQKVCCLLGFFV